MAQQADKMQGFEGGTLFYIQSRNEVFEGNWYRYNESIPVGGGDRTASRTGTVITKDEMRSAVTRVQPYSTTTCPPESKHGNDLPEYDCKRAVYVTARGVHMPFRRGREDGEAGTGGFGITHAFVDHAFEMRWAELILQDQEQVVESSTNPETGREVYTWRLGAEFSYSQGGRRTYVQALEVVIEPGPPGPANAPIDGAPMGLVTAFCRAKDQNGTMMQFCPPVNMPGPFIRKESDAYDWSGG